MRAAGTDQHSSVLKIQKQACAGHTLSGRGKMRHKTFFNYILGFLLHTLFLSRYLINNDVTSLNWWAANNG